MDDLTRKTRSVLAVLDSIRAESDRIDLRHVQTLANVGELRISLETLCDQLCESDTQLSSNTYNRLRELCDELRIDKEWQELVPFRHSRP